MATSRTGKDACDLLDADHRALKKLFKEYHELAGSRARGAAQRRLELAHRICRELTVHAQVEEEILYYLTPLPTSLTTKALILFG
mgnify:CR=1 FL=1